MMKIYESPELDVISFASAESITDSGDAGVTGSETAKPNPWSLLWDEE